MTRPLLLERDRELAELIGFAGAALAGTGTVVLLSGEAGIGKSSVVRAVGDRLPSGCRQLVGRCDDLATPRTLGPLRDLAAEFGPDLAAAVRDGADREALLAALGRELRRPGRATVLVIDDVHWADEATLDVLRYLARRIADLPVVLVLTYRDDEVTRAHPVQQVLGAAAGSGRVRRLPLRRLSEDAVRRLSASTRFDPAQLYALTSGNPFFLGEVLASADVDDRGSGVPRTVVDAVLARVQRLDRPVADALEQLAVIPSAAESWLVDALLPAGLGPLGSAEERGLLVVSPQGVAFRHELVRRAIVDTLPMARQIALNRRVLRVLAGREGADLTRLVHHATQAGDVDAVVTYGPAAAREAAAAGAHREAAAHYALALRHRDRFAPADRAELLERCAIERYTVGNLAGTVGLQNEAIALRRSLGDPVALGADLRWLSRMCWILGDRAGAERAAAEAIEVLEPAGDRRMLAYALSNRAQLHMLAHRMDDCLLVGERAIALAREVGDPIVLAHALNNVGTARRRVGDTAGESLVDESLRLALEAGDTEEACRSYANLLWQHADELRLADARRRLPEAVALAESSDQLAYASYFRVILARLELAAGAWAEAERAARSGVNDMAGQRATALTVIGRVRVRRGEPDGADVLREAWRVAEPLGELQRSGPVAAALAEAAWLAGDLAEVRAVAGPVYEQARRLRHPSLRAELGYWLTRAGSDEVEPDPTHPYGVQAAGRWREAAAAWQAAGCPYEHAAALAESPDPQDRVAVLATLDRLGAVALVRRIRAGLRKLGVAHPRGPGPASRASPAGLTDRQLQVLRLLSERRTNAEIADRLVVSVRTVDSHVAALLAKLGAASRRQAAARAAELGILDRE